MNPGNKFPTCSCQFSCCNINLSKTGHKVILDSGVHGLTDLIDDMHVEIIWVAKLLGTHFVVQHQVKSVPTSPSVPNMIQADPQYMNVVVLPVDQPDQLEFQVLQGNKTHRM